MKKTTLLLAVLAIAGNAYAADGYFEASAGKGHINIDCTDTSKCSQSSTGWKLIGGLKLTQNIALEGMFINYGRAYADGLYYGYPLGGEAKATGFGAGAAYALPLGSGFSVTGRAGLVLNRSKVTADLAGVTSKATESRLMPYLGAEVGYQLTDSMAVVAGADISRARNGNDNATVRLLSLGLKWGL